MLNNFLFRASYKFGECKKREALSIAPDCPLCPVLQQAINRGALRPCKICPLKKRPSIFLSNALLVSKFLFSGRINRQKHRHEYTDNTLTGT